MVRSLCKTRLDGTLYCRRSAVEAEIQELMAISISELERRVSIFFRGSPDFVSSEALVHFVRKASAGMHREKLIERLLQRVALLSPRVEVSGESTASLTKTNIRDDILDHFIDLLLSDQAKYDDRLDYYEVNFNAAIARDRKDASDRHWKRENLSEELNMGEVSDDEETENCNYEVFDPHELDKKNYRLWLEDAIDTLPELQRRIVEMWRQEIPIDSQDPSAVTISKALGKSEKTIRTHRDKAFATLRLRLERKGKL